MTRLRFIQSDDSKHLSVDFCTQVQVSDKYAPYREDIMALLFEFQLKWNVQLGCITGTKHRIKLLDNHPRPVNSALYRKNPRMEQFEKPKIDEIL